MDYFAQWPVPCSADGPLGLVSSGSVDQRLTPSVTLLPCFPMLLPFQTNGHMSGNGDVYQERLSRLENDKESLVLQVSGLFLPAS